MAMDAHSLMVVDDEAINLSILSEILLPLCAVRAYKSGQAALAALAEGFRPDLILLDVVMPGMDGFTTLSHIRDDATLREIPVIFITALDNPDDEDIGFRMGAVDYITKPIRPSTVLARVNAHLELKVARDRLRRQNVWLSDEVKRQLEIIRLVQTAAITALMRLAETRDENTGNHIRRTSKYVETLALEMRKSPRYAKEWTDTQISLIASASQLHDIGKVGIPDHILQKPAKLTAEEFAIIQTHCAIGAAALRNAKHEALLYLSDEDRYKMQSALLFLDEAERIAQNHHERWDGAGYPAGLKGEQIPPSARLMMLADVFDALSTERPYKKAWPWEQTVGYILAQEGKAFDPEVVSAFRNRLDDFRQIREVFADATEGGSV